MNLQDKYTYQSLTHFNVKSEEEEKERKSMKLYNPNIKFELELYYINKTIINNKIKFYDKQYNLLFGNKAYFNTKISEFNIYIVYDYDNSNCSDYFDYINKLNEDEQYFILHTNYQGFKLDHQNPEKPIQRTENGENIFFYIRNGLKHNFTNVQIYYWQNIIYTEKKLFEKTPDSCGYIPDYSLYNNKLETKELLGKNYIILNEISINTIFTEYLEYQRTRISELDLIANILSLFSNFFL